MNYAFAFIFTIEAVLKIGALGFVLYFNDKGNIFDFLVMVSTIITSAVSIALNVDFAASTTFIKALRITKLFKKFKLGRQMQIIIDTMIYTLPALTNIGGLLILFLYIYSVLGVFLFAEVQL